MKCHGQPFLGVAYSLQRNGVQHGAETGVAQSFQIVRKSIHTCGCGEKGDEPAEQGGIRNYDAGKKIWIKETSFNVVLRVRNHRTGIHLGPGPGSCRNRDYRRNESFPDLRGPGFMAKQKFPDSRRSYGKSQGNCFVRVHGAAAAQRDDAVVSPFQKQTSTLGNTLTVRVHGNAGKNGGFNTVRQVVSHKSAGYGKPGQDLIGHQ